MPAFTCPNCSKRVNAAADADDELICPFCLRHFAPANAQRRDPFRDIDAEEYEPPRRAATRQKTNGDGIGLIVAGYVCGAIALLFFPPGFGLAGAACGIINLTKNRIGHGIAQIVISVTCGIIGAALGEAARRGRGF